MIHFNGKREFLKRSVARIILPLTYVKGAIITRGPRPTPTGVVLKLLCRKPYRYWSDGSLRHADARFATPGHARRKAEKRRRRYDLNGRRVAWLVR